MLHIPRWQTALTVLIILLGIAFAAPNLISRDAAERLPDWLPKQQLSLGLDLQGGSYLLLEVETETVIQDQLNTLVDEVRTRLRNEGIGYSELGIDDREVTFELNDPADADQARSMLREIGAQQARDAFGGMTNPIRVSIDGDGRGTISYTSDAFDERIRNAVEQSIEIVRRRIDETGVREPTIQRQGDARIVVQLPGVTDPERMKDLLGQTARLTFRLVNEDISPQADRIPPGSERLPSDETGPDNEPLQYYVVQRRTMVSGENLTDARPTFQDGQPVVSFTFDSVGAQRFATATRENVRRPFAIVLDDAVISAPVIREPILGGSGVISGNFTTEEVQDLALLLRAGALPAPLTIMEERTVGPGLGADSVEAGQWAAVAAFVLVIGVMLVIYGQFGLWANIALLTNMVLILGALSWLQATLTLPGIAGIVLTLGMAVDANVLIFERIREEARNYRGPVSAVDAGYRRAITTILDANITTLIAAVLLYQFGSGPVRGFAVTLAIGLATSMFTAIMLTRSIMATWLRRRRPQALPI